MKGLIGLSRAIGCNVTGQMEQVVVSIFGRLRREGVVARVARVSGPFPIGLPRIDVSCVVSTGMR